MVHSIAALKNQFENLSKSNLAIKNVVNNLQETKNIENRNESTSYFLHYNLLLLHLNI